MHLWPAVPTAPKKTAGTARERSASGIMIDAVFGGNR